MRNPIRMKDDIYDRLLLPSYIEGFKVSINATYYYPTYTCPHTLALTNHEYTQSLPGLTLLQTLTQWRNPEMARKAKRNDYSMPEMVSAKLSAEDKVKFEKWLEKAGADWALLLGDVIAEDWKIGVSFDAKNDTFIASATQKAEEHTWYNYCVLSRHTDYQKALAITVFKLRELYYGKRPESIGIDQDWG